MEKEYPISLGMKIFYGILGAGIFVFAVFFFNLPHTSKTPGWFNIIPTLFLISGILIFINIFKRKVIVYDDRIITIGLFSTKEIFIESIKGVRVGQKIIYIEPLNAGDAQLRIGNYIDLKNSSELVRWLSSNFKDLDSIDLTDEHNKILHDSELGVTEAEREKTLKKSKKFALIYNIGGAVALIFIFFFYSTIEAAIVVILYPLIGVIVIVSSKGLIKFASNPKRSVHPSVLFGFVLPSFFALIISLDIYTIYKLANFWFPALSITTFIFIVVYKKGINKSGAQIKAEAILTFIFVAAYSFASTLQINCALDNSPAQIYKAAVLDHHISYGSRHTSYYLTLSAWGPRETEKEVEVRGHIYRSVDIGDSVNVVFKQGLLHIPWFIVTKE